MSSTPSCLTRYRRTALVVASVSTLLCGCTSMSGLSGHSDYACKAPEGVVCESVSGVYANAVANNLPSQRRPLATPSSAGPTAAATPPPRSASASIGTPTASAPLRSTPRILRVWFKPWEDADGDLFDQGYLYVQIDAGRWLVEHAQRAIREAYAPVLAPSPRAQNTSSPRPAEPSVLPPVTPGSARPQ